MYEPTPDEIIDTMIEFAIRDLEVAKQLSKQQEGHNDDANKN